MNKNINQEKIMKRRDAKVYFDNQDMDFTLMWVLGQTSDDDEVRRLMTANLRGEITERREIDG